MSKSWRYQAVFTKHETEDDEMSKEYSICEVYFDEEGKLYEWTEKRDISPSGYNIDELKSDLHMMLDCVEKWKPVEYDSLKEGMTFLKNGKAGTGVF